ncbi:MAG: low molecular weight phosphotyrosine protein phosphatase [Oscillospiraceae bacterium]|nr:low molecular weight phosphotyrosine protein phosphatase [Oscillospiraceae bacterium]
MIRVMFVCHGNICRSPMAEMMMKELVRQEGLAGRIVIASAGTSDEEILNGIGNPVYPPARAVLKQHGIPCEPHRAAQLRKSDYADYDLFICMDSLNLRNIMRIFGGDPAGKVRSMLSFAGRDADVSDPWFSGRFDTAYADIDEGCRALLQYLKKEGLL